MTTLHKRKQISRRMITPEYIRDSMGMSKLGPVGIWAARAMMVLFKIDQCNTLFAELSHYEQPDLSERLFEAIEVNFEIHEDDLKRIPRQGPFAVVSNHPLGIVDGALLIKLISEIRPDFKVVASFLLSQIEPFSPYIFPVNSFERHREIASSIPGMRAAFQHLRQGHPMGIFPAGEVSTYDRKQRAVVDRPWKKSAIKLIKRAQVSVVPVYFHARNSALFYRLARLSDNLRTAMLPREFLKRNKGSIKIRIGPPISVKDQEAFSDLEEYGTFLRRKTYMLSNSYDEERKKIERLLKRVNATLRKPAKVPKDLIPAIPPEQIEAELGPLRGTEKHLFTNRNYEIFFAGAPDIPEILREIGRLRELTFREVDEGTNEEVDLDEHDVYYHHLFTWDCEKRKIVGAYRIGLGAEIFPNSGIAGFYIAKLFTFKPEMQPFLKQSIEMGRAFVVKEYQRRPMSLFLLWKGILHITQRYPQHEFLLGCVSISKQFSNFSKSMMVEFIRSNHYDLHLAQYVRPKKAFKVKLKDEDKNFVLDSVQADLNELDKLIDYVEPGNLRLPILIKKYIKQNAQIIAFNVDPKFNHALDGLMYVRISEIPETDSAVPGLQGDLEQEAGEGDSQA